MLEFLKELFKLVNFTARKIDVNQRNKILKTVNKLLKAVDADNLHDVNLLTSELLNTGAKTRKPESATS